jgi:hypothetical protein
MRGSALVPHELADASQLVLTKAVEVLRLIHGGAFLPQGEYDKRIAMWIGSRILAGKENRRDRILPLYPFGGLTRRLLIRRGWQRRRSHFSQVVHRIVWPVGHVHLLENELL